MKAALCQINTVPGDLAGNRALIVDAALRAQAAGADLAVFPELAVVGYCPRDLLFRERFQEAAERSLAQIAAETAAIPVLAGSIRRNPGRGRPFFNSAFLLAGGEARPVADKALIPAYDVFDEGRYFEPAHRVAPVEFGGVKIGVTICEDLWTAPGAAGASRYERDPAADLVAAGASCILNLSASPYHLGKISLRIRLVADTAKRLAVPVALCNLWGGNDEILFDGTSTAADSGGETICRLPSFAAGLSVVDLFGAGGAAGDRGGAGAMDPVAELRQALVMGISDYARKTGFSRCVIGLSGGIDSAVCACLAVDALGAGNVAGIAMPSPFSSEGSIRDASELARRCGIEFHVAPIGETYACALSLAKSVVGDGPFGLMEENLQARIRGLLLMAVSNRRGSLLITTGNKSELAVGYCTLYGDMCGGLAAISDVYKTDVYKLGALYGALGLIPESSLLKPPAAELRPGQRDQDTLPPYDLLDAILLRHVDREQSLPGIVAEVEGASPGLVHRIMALVGASEYKRRQAAPGLRVSSKAFGYGRRVPIVANPLGCIEGGAAL